jgi:hypothetical protein
MAVEKSHTAEAGVASGTTVTTGNSATGGDAFDVVTISGSGATFTYDNTNVHGGSLALKHTAPAVASAEQFQWTTLTSRTTYWVRFYLYITATTPPSCHLVMFRNGSSMSSGVILNPGRTLTLDDSTFSGRVSTSNAVALNQWVRIEFKAICSATVGQMELKLFNSAESTTPTETVTSTAAWNTNTAITRMDFGYNATGAFTFWTDDIVVENAAYPGPVVVAAAPLPESRIVSQAVNRSYTY